jgi:glutamyl-Q tRNA(Asp) synthetase
MTNKPRLSFAPPLSLLPNSQTNYIGRFAPSPTGPLHFGSLVCALASYLHAKQHDGKWLVRIEDIDTPRVDQGTIKTILTTLEAHALCWDDDVIYQSQRHELYKDYLRQLNNAKHLYACSCTRSQVRARTKSTSYDKHCRNLHLPFSTNAVRFKHITNNSVFEDLFWGSTRVTDTIATEDPVLRRADGIFSYNLAVVVDDIEQKISHIVRGSDLRDTTPVHLSLYQAISAPVPQYLHIPIVVQKPGEKLSKQHYSPALDNDKALDHLKLARIYLGLDAKKLLEITTCEQLLYWAIANWQPNLMPKQSELLISVINGVYSKPKNMQAAKAATDNKINKT